MADRFNERIQKRIEEKMNPAEEGLRREEGEVKGRERYAFAAALFFYHSEAGYRHIPYQIKYQGNLEAGRYFGRMLGRRLAGAGRARPEAAGGRGAEDCGAGAAGPWADVDMVIPVPLHWMRRWKRGYNQAEVIAGAVAEAMDVPMRNDILIRRRRTETQVKLKVEDKARNVSGAFAVSEEAAALYGRPVERYGEDGSVRASGRRGSGSHPRHILIVDDVFTTGSTLAACHEAIREVFPAEVRISVVTLGYLER